MGRVDPARHGMKVGHGTRTGRRPSNRADVVSAKVFSVRPTAERENLTDLICSLWQEGWTNIINEPCLIGHTPERESGTVSYGAQNDEEYPYSQ